MQSVVEMRAETKKELEEFLVRADADLAAALFVELRDVVTTYEELKARAGRPSRSSGCWRSSAS